MIEKTEEHYWRLKNDDDSYVFSVSAYSNGVIGITADNLETLEDYRQFHRAIGEAIAVAEAQDD